MKNKLDIDIKRLTTDSLLPIYKTHGAAGMDLFSNETKYIYAKEQARISTGIAMAIPDGYYGRIASRSGLAVKHGIHSVAGVIDSDYRGDIKVVLINFSNYDYVVHKGDRIAQIIIEKYFLAELCELKELDLTTRGGDGFGSTGV